MPTLSHSIVCSIQGQDVHEYICTNDHGSEMTLISWGASVTSLRVPDRNGELDNVVLGWQDVGAYEHQTTYLGCIVGRHANRIANGRCEVDGQTLSLATNNGTNHLHGGPGGFSMRNWTCTPIQQEDRVGVDFALTSPDGEEGYPGTLSVHVHIVLTNENQVVFSYSATTDKTTIVNLTHHGYFQLGSSPTILDHVACFPSTHFTPISDSLIPLGKHNPVDDTPFDFQTPKPIGQDIDTDHPQLQNGQGYDHNFVINANTPYAAKVWDPSSGRVLEMTTTEPGFQFYSGNFLQDNTQYRNGRVLGRRGGFCLEAQHPPDAPNQPAFPSTVLQPNKTYTQTTTYQFSTSDKSPFV